MRPVIFPYRIHSGAARAVARALGVKCVYPDGEYRPRPGHAIICWGASGLPQWWAGVKRASAVLNPPGRIGIAINKLRSFEALSKLGVSTPLWTTDRTKALEWQANERVVVARKSLTSSGGRGIVLVEKGDKMPDCYLYTQHIRHKHEYRVHVFNHKVIDVQEKRKRSDMPEERTRLQSLIRNWDHGWVFCHDNVNAPKVVLEESLKAIEVLGLDFGAVDVGYREKDGKAFIFEVNTAPGLEGQTLDKYVAAIREFCR